MKLHAATTMTMTFAYPICSLTLGSVTFHGSDLGKNADLYLYVANQESTDLISEVHVEDVP